MLRALRETEIEGVATTIPADIAILEHPDFIDVEHSTKLGRGAAGPLRAWPPPAPPAGRPADGEPPGSQRDVDVEVNGRRFQVKLWVPDAAPQVVGGRRAGRPAGRPARRPGGGGGHGGGPAGSGSVTVPMQGTIVKVLVGGGRRRRGRSGRLRARGHEDGEPHRRRDRRHRHRDQGRSRATPSAPATWSPSSSSTPPGPSPAASRPTSPPDGIAGRRRLGYACPAGRSRRGDVAPSCHHQAEVCRGPIEGQGGRGGVDRRPRRPVGSRRHRRVLRDHRGRPGRGGDARPPSGSSRPMTS